MRKTLIAFFLICSTILCSAQQFENEIKALIKDQPKLEIKLDSRNSFISSSNVRVFGIKVGLIHGNKLSYGIGYNFLLSDIKTNNFRVDSELTAGQLFYRYWSPYVDYVFYEDSRWQLSIPIQFGLGSTFFKTDLTDNTKIGKEFVLSYEPAITFQYRVLKYFAVGAGIGYRLMIVDNANVEERFNSPVYLLKLKFLFQDFYKDILN